MKVVIYSGSLVHCAAGREDHGKQTSLACVGCACSVWATLGFPAHGLCAFPIYTAQAPACSAGELSKVGLGLPALPRSKPLRFRFSGAPQRRRLGWACVLCLSQVRAAQATGAWWAPSPRVHCVLSPPHPGRSVSWVCSGSAVSGVRVSSGELISGCNPPGRCPLSRIPGRLG